MWIWKKTDASVKNGFNWRCLESKDNEGYFLSVRVYERSLFLCVNFFFPALEQRATLAFKGFWLERAHTPLFPLTPMITAPPVPACTQQRINPLASSLCANPPAVHLTSSRRMTRKHANYFRATDRRASIHAFRFLCAFSGRLVNTPRVACHHGGWHVYTPSFLGVRGVTVGWPRTASNERVHSFCGFLSNPFIQDLCLWRTSQEFVKTDLYPLSRGLWSLSGMPSVRPGTCR